MTFLTTLKEIEEPIQTENGKIGPLNKHETIEVSKKIAKDLLKGNLFAKRAWQCPKCHEIFREKEHGKEPPFCKNPNCDSKKLFPLHPSKHHEIGNVLMDEYLFKTMEESGDIYHFNGSKVFESKTSEPLIEGKTKEMVDNCKGHLQDEVIRHIKTKTYEPKENFGLPKEKIAVENGILNLEEKELEDFNPEKQYPLAKIPIKYNPEAEIGKIETEIIDEIFQKEDKPLIQEYAGYCLYKDYPYAKALVLLGGGANGKSTFINLLLRFLGKDNVSGSSLYKLLTDEHTRVNLYGKLANLAAETPDALKNTDDFKKMTGDDLLDARRLYQESFKFKNYAKLIFAANQLPETNDYTDAFFRRIMLVDCPYKFTKNPHDNHKNANPDILEEIITEENLSGMLNWALEGLDRVLDKGGFSETKSREEIKERWIRETDPERAFINKFLETDYNYYVIRSDIHEAYKEYCNENELEAKDQAQLTKKIKSSMTSASKYTPEIDGKRQRAFKNVKLSDPYSEYNRGVGDGQEKLDKECNACNAISKKLELENENDSINKKINENSVTRVTQEVVDEFFEVVKSGEFTKEELLEFYEENKDVDSETVESLIDRFLKNGKLMEVLGGELEVGSSD